MPELASSWAALGPTATASRCPLGAVAETEFENFSVFKPSDYQALNTMLDQVVVWSTASHPSAILLRIAA